MEPFRYVSLSQGNWSLRVACPHEIKNENYTIGVYRWGKLWDGRPDPNSGQLETSKIIKVADAPKSRQCSTDTEVVYLDKNTTLSTHGLGDQATLNFHLSMGGECADLEKIAKRSKFTIQFGDTKDGVLAPREVGRGIESPGCGLTWDSRHRYSKSGTYEVQVFQDGVPRGRLSVVIVLVE